MFVTRVTLGSTAWSNFIASKRHAVVNNESEIELLTLEFEQLTHMLVSILWNRYLHTCILLNCVKMRNAKNWGGGNKHGMG